MDKNRKKFKKRKSFRVHFRIPIPKFILKNGKQMTRGSAENRAVGGNQSSSSAHKQTIKIRCGRRLFWAKLPRSNMGIFFKNITNFNRRRVEGKVEQNNKIIEQKNFGQKSQRRSTCQIEKGRLLYPLRYGDPEILRWWDRTHIYNMKKDDLATLP